MNRKKILGVGGGVGVPSSFYRLSVLKHHFDERGVQLDEWVPKFSRYPPPGLMRRIFWLSRALPERAKLAGISKKYDAVILQRELISTIPTFERFLGRPLIFDVDDAVFMRRNGIAAKSISKNSDLVVCGNEYLADWFSDYSANVSVIPTGVDVDSMKVLDNRLARERRIIGWIGTSSNIPFLNRLADPLVSLVNKYPDAEVRVVTDSIASMDERLAAISNFVKWYPGVEFDELPAWALGLMPLADSPWSRGKCSFKMIQYMSAGIPVVVSPVGMNNEVLARAELGFSAANVSEWYERIECLINDEALNAFMGKEGRRVAEDFYSLQSVADMWQRVLSEFN